MLFLFTLSSAGCAGQQLQQEFEHCTARCLLTIGQSSVFKINWFWREELSKSENSYSVNTCGLWEAFRLSVLSAFKKVLAAFMMSVRQICLILFLTGFTV